MHCVFVIQKHPPEMFQKNDILKNFAKFTGKHFALDSSDGWGLGLRLPTLLKKDSGTGVSCEFCDISKNTFFTEHIWTTASKHT